MNRDQLIVALQNMPNLPVVVNGGLNDLANGQVLNSIEVIEQERYNPNLSMPDGDWQTCYGGEENPDYEYRRVINLSSQWPRS